MLKVILAKTLAAVFAVAAVLVLPAVADQNAAKNQNGTPCLKIICESGTIQNHCDRPVNFAACHAESRNGCLLKINPRAQIPPKESLPFACTPGKLPQADGCFPPFIPVSFSALQSGCIPNPENPRALSAAAALPQASQADADATPPPAGTPTENALRKCGQWNGQLSANEVVNTEENKTLLKLLWTCHWLHVGTHLHFAALMSDSNSARWLIANGALVNAKNGYGETPLDVAIFAESTEIQPLLKRHGGQCNEKC